MTNAVVTPETTKPQTKLQRQIINFVVFEVDPAWRRLPEPERKTSKQQFAEVIRKFTAEKRCQILTYTTMGVRGDGEIMLWVIAHDLNAVQELATALAATGLGHYLSRAHSFLSMTKRSMYLDRFNPEHPEDRAHLVPGKHKYMFVYPFVKKRDWYVLPLKDRQELMDEHITIGNKYPSVKLNTTYSFGLDDQDFVVAFETDYPSDFLDLVQELRESKASMYTLRDTPIITAIHKDIDEMLDTLGG